MTENFINADRFQSRLTKELRIKGAMSTPAPVLAPEIQPVIIVEGERPELLHLQREHRFSCTLAQGAAAGEYYYFQLWNPAGRNGIVVVEEFGVADGTATSAFDFGYADATVTAALALRASYCLDSRVPGWAPRTGVAGPVVGTDAVSGAIDVFGRVPTLANSMQVVRPNVVVTPGYGFSIWNTVADHTVSGYCFWRERQAEDGELI